jgi:hypothetical protein
MEETKNEGFLSRWSRRKVEARIGNEAPELPVEGPVAPAVLQQEVPEAPEPNAAGDAHERLPAAPAISTNENAEASPLTLADVAELTRDSDFSRFVASGVDADVKNAALKKLFSDPHFNLMDGLDVYIDDYSAASPLPQHLLVKMVQAKFLGLVKQKADEALARLPDMLADDAGHGAPVQTVASEPPANSIAPHEDADLQLQPDDDAGRSGAASGPGEDAGRQH